MKHTSKQQPKTPQKMTRFSLPTSTLSAAMVAALSTTSTVYAQEDSQRSVTLSPILVTSDPLGNRSVDDLIQPVTVLSGESLERRRSSGTLGEVLDGLPGVASSDFGPGVGRPVIRGLQGSRVQVLEDGLRSIDVSGEGADHAVGVDALRAESIEILRGPSTLIYGSGAAGGVVNVVTRRFSPVIPDRATGTVQGSYGENGKDRQGHISLDAPVSSQFAIRADYSIRRTDDFDIRGFQQSDQVAGNRNTLANSDMDNDAYSITGMWSGVWGYVGLGYSNWETEYGIPENFDARPRPMGGQSDDFERIFAEYDRVDLRSEIYNPFTGFSALRLKMAYTEFEQQEVEFEFERTPGGGVLDERVVEAEFEKKEFETRLELLHNPIAGMNGVIGLEFGNSEFLADDPRGEERGFYVRPTTTRTLSLFLVEEIPTDFGKLEFGMRIGRERSNPGNVFGYRVDGVDGSDGDFIPFQDRLQTRDFTLASFSVGGLVNVGPDHHFRTSITAAERAPSPEQLYAFGRHAAAGTFEVGDPNLNKETYLNFEVGFDRHYGPMRYDVTAFYNLVDDYTYLRSEDDGSGSPVLVSDVGDRAAGNLRNQLVFNEQADAEFYGIEAGATIDLATGELPVAMRLSGDYVVGSLRDGGNLPRITPPRAGVGFDTYWQDFAFSVDYQRVFKQTRTGEAEDSTRGFNLFGFDVVWQPTEVEGLRLFVNGRNLANQDGRRHQSFFKDEAPIIGRSFTTGVRYDF